MTLSEAAGASSLRIGVIGDLHTHWDEVDVAQFGQSDYDLLFFIGDLGGGSRDSSLRVARTISRLDKNALVMPGNNDTGDMRELAAELSHRIGVRRITALRTGEQSDASIGLCGYSLHRLRRGTLDVTLLAARPHGMGGPDLSFPEHMSSAYGIHSLDESTQRLCQLVDATETDDMLFFSHNGPTGLGVEPHDMWGCDFKPGGGDWGDPDLEAAIHYARTRGKRVLAVVAGHMHLRTKQGVERDWIRVRNDILYVNAARVPRIFASDDDIQRHHVSLHVDTDGVQVKEMFVPQHSSG